MVDSPRGEGLVSGPPHLSNNSFGFSPWSRDQWAHRDRSPVLLQRISKKHPMLSRHRVCSFNLSQTLMALNKVREWPLPLLHHTADDDYSLDNNYHRQIDQGSRFDKR